MEGWSRAARPLTWTWMRLRDKLKKLNKDHAVEINFLSCCNFIMIRKLHISIIALTDG